MYCEYKIYW